jgi:ribosomal protein L16
LGQKVHPYGFRLGFNKTWRSRWFSGKDYAKLLHEDLALRQDLKKRFSHAGVSRIETERAANNLKIDKLKQEIQKRTSRQVFINIQEIQKPELEAQLIAESVAVQLEKRVAFRRAMRKAVESALRFGARGIKVRVFPDKPITKKPQETRMGKGKGAPEEWVCVVRPGKILFEMEGVNEIEAKAAMRLAAAKLPIKTKFATRFAQEKAS